MFPGTHDWFFQCFCVDHRMCFFVIQSRDMLTISCNISQLHVKNQKRYFNRRRRGKWRTCLDNQFFNTLLTKIGLLVQNGLLVLCPSDLRSSQEKIQNSDRFTWNSIVVFLLDNFECMHEEEIHPLLEQSTQLDWTSSLLYYLLSQWFNLGRLMLPMNDFQFHRNIFLVFLAFWSVALNPNVSFKISVITSRW